MKTDGLSSSSVSLPHWAHVTFTQLRSDPNASSSSSANDKRVHYNHTFPSFQGETHISFCDAPNPHCLWKSYQKSLIFSGVNCPFKRLEKSFTLSAKTSHFENKKLHTFQGKIVPLQRGKLSPLKGVNVPLKRGNKC